MGKPPLPIEMYPQESAQVRVRWKLDLLRAIREYIWWEEGCISFVAPLIQRNGWRLVIYVNLKLVPKLRGLGRLRSHYCGKA